MRNKFKRYKIQDTRFALLAASLDLSKEYGFGNNSTVGETINNLIQPIFIIAGILVVFFFLIGAVKYISSGGEKEAVQSARGMITHAIIGIILLMFMFLFLKWFPGALGLKDFQFFSQ